MKASDETSLSGLIALKLRNTIISGEIVPGTPLIELELCKRYQASRSTICEVLRQLRNEGLIYYILNRGAQVRVLTLSDISDIYKVRHTREISAIQNSSFANDLHFNTNDKILIEGEETVKESRWNVVGTSSRFFPHAIVGLLESERLHAYFSTILAQLPLIFAMPRNERRFQGGWLERDRRIYMHLVAGQRSEAAELMRLYLYDSETYVSDIVLGHTSQ